MRYYGGFEPLDLQGCKTSSENASELGHIQLFHCTFSANVCSASALLIRKVTFRLLYEEINLKNQRSQYRCIYSRASWKHIWQLTLDFTLRHELSFLYCMVPSPGFLCIESCKNSNFWFHFSHYCTQISFG